ncbi:MAG: AAA family ATPase, partial [Gemmatimonadetes bacterium]|nr:AAA family ATPase [Gemmatimonadota bacterium]
MVRLFKRASEKQKSFWQRAVDLALTDVRVATGGLDTEALESLEERLLAADFGVAATLRLVDHVESLARRGQVRNADDMLAALKHEIERILAPAASAGLELAAEGVSVILVVGINGVGKTTSAAKLAHWLGRQGKSVLLAAGDTFRAGAIDQLRIWAERAGAEFVGAEPGGDPAAVAYDAVEHAKSRMKDVVLLDTAGRMQTNTNLMDEMKKIKRVAKPDMIVFVGDSLAGNDAVEQAVQF